MNDMVMTGARPRPIDRNDSRGRPLGQILLSAGRISPPQLVSALAQQSRTQAPLGQILIANSVTPERTILDALAAQSAAPVVQTSFSKTPFYDSDPTFWITHHMIPWSKAGPLWLVACVDARIFQKHKAEIESRIGPCAPLLTPQSHVMRRLSFCFGDYLTERAETELCPRLSCRTLTTDRVIQAALLMCLCLLALISVSKGGFIVMQALLILASLALTAVVGFKIHILFATLARPSAPVDVPHIAPQNPLPKFSILVPLYKEEHIAARLLQRLQLLSYPKTHIELILILEQDDDVTRNTIAATALPFWMRVIQVPRGSVTTKPRAMNYALPFCSGDIIGIYDAEDAPLADQLEQVVAQFARSPSDVVCLQGCLDFYNPAQNWIARCFTSEYNSWFRVALKGMARLGYVLPLGGTTVFMRAQPLRDLAAWDAHNVTEDADLGLRLARAGWRCDLLASTTYEQANAHPIAWIKQRSRWLKGYLMTYLVHMRRPVKLYRDLGPRRFLGVQITFGASLVLFALAPVFWVFWLDVFGGVPSTLMPLSETGTWALRTLFVMALCVDMALQYIGLYRAGLIGASKKAPHHNRKDRRFWLIPPTSYFYFPLATIAMYKALYEVLTHPFYWDKTHHG